MANPPASAIVDNDRPLSATGRPTSHVHGARLSRARLETCYDAIVIGSGISGLASAAFLARDGRRVLTLERHYLAGGFTHTFRRRGFEWDTGLHYVGGVHRPNDRLRCTFDYITGGRVEWRRLPAVMDRISLPGSSFDYVAGAASLRDALVREFPREANGIHEYMDLIEGFEVHTRRFALTKVLPPGLARLASPLVARRFHALARRTTAEVLDELFNDQRLEAILTARYGNYGLPPKKSSFAAHAMVESHFLDGASYPVGGSSVIAREAIRTIEDHGGSVVVQASVERILVSGGRAHGVEFADGREVRAPIVISSIGARNTYERMLRGVREAEAGRRRLATLRPSTGHVGLYLGLEGSPQSLGLDESNLWIHAGRDHDALTAAHEENPESSLPLVFVSAPKSCGVGPTGKAKTALEAIAPAPFHHFRRWADQPWKRRGDGYDALKNSYGRRLLAALESRYPGIGAHIRVREVSTPLSTATFSGHRQGQIYGIASTPERFLEPSLRPHTPIRGLFLTGQDALVPGIGGALMAGLVTSSAVMRTNLLARVSRPYCSQSPARGALEPVPVTA